MGLKTGGTPKISSKEQVLFLGGAADGRRISVRDDLGYVYYPTYPEYVARTSEGYETSFETQVYRLEKIHGKNKRFTLAIYDKLSIDEALERLLDGYRLQETMV